MRMPSRLRPRAIERYILRELSVPFVLTLVVASLLLVSGQLFGELLNKAVNRGMGLDIVSQGLLFFLLPMFIHALPVALLLAVLIAYGRLSEDHEIVAMQASGVSWTRIFRPVLLLGLIASIFNCWLANGPIPRLQGERRAFLVRTVTTQPTMMLQERTWLPEAYGMHVWIGAIDDEESRLHDLRIYRDAGDGNTQFITAETGQIEIEPGSMDIFVRLHNGTLHESVEADAAAYNIVEFESLRFPFPVQRLQKWAARSIGTRIGEWSLGQLLRALRAARAEGKSTRKVWREIGERTSMPFACLSFVLLAAPLSIRPHKSRRNYGAGVSIGLATTFYLLYTVGKVMARSDVVHPLISLWMPNLLLSGAGVVALVRQWRK